MSVRGKLCFLLIVILAGSKETSPISSHIIPSQGLTDEELLRGVKNAWDKGWRNVRQAPLCTGALHYVCCVFDENYR